MCWWAEVDIDAVDDKLFGQSQNEILPVVGGQGKIAKGASGRWGESVRGQGQDAWPRVEVLQWKHGQEGVNGEEEDMLMNRK